MEPAIYKKDIEKKLPPVPVVDLLPAILKVLQTNRYKIIILDDDPTGTQTVHDVAVITQWDEDTIEQELLNEETAFFILTNTRSMEAGEAIKVNIEIASAIKKIATRENIKYIIISRSDSTLRGHFPCELYALQQGLQSTTHSFVLFPFFEEGGRFTINDVHYLEQQDKLVPVAETAFAKDHSFGYTQSNLKQYIIEKLGNEIPEQEIISISIEDLRSDNNVLLVMQKLLSLKPRQYCIVNAFSFYDATVFALAVLRLSPAKEIIYRSAASFVQAICGISRQPLLHNIREKNNSNGGLTIVGSYVPLTSEQVAVTIQHGDVETIEINVHGILNHPIENRLPPILYQLNDLLEQKKDVVIFTSRHLVTGRLAETDLSVGNKISNFLVQLVHGLEVRPAYIIAKGGITSSDIATKGLGAKRAIIKGQALPGVPVWEMGSESLFPGLNYVVFPGNVGDSNALNFLIGTLKN